MATSTKPAKRVTPTKSTPRIAKAKAAAVTRAKSAHAVTVSSRAVKSDAPSTRDTTTSRANLHMERAWALLSKSKK